MSNCGKLFWPHAWMSAFHYFKLGTPRQSLPCMGPERKCPDKDCSLNQSYSFSFVTKRPNGFAFVHSLL